MYASATLSFVLSWLSYPQTPPSKYDPRAGLGAGNETKCWRSLPTAASCMSALVSRASPSHAKEGSGQLRIMVLWAFATISWSWRVNHKWRASTCSSSCCARILTVHMHTRYGARRIVRPEQPHGLPQTASNYYSHLVLLAHCWLCNTNSWYEVDQTLPLLRRAGPRLCPRILNIIIELVDSISRDGPDRGHTFNCVLWQQLYPVGISPQPPRKFWKFRLPEDVSEAFWRPFRGWFS